MKGIISMILSLAIVCSISSPAFAANKVGVEDSTSSVAHAEVQMEIQRRTVEVMKDVYAQLESQDALVLLDVYEKIIAADITQEVQAEFGVVSPQGNRVFYMPNGGLITYLVPVPGYEPTEVAVTCLERQRTLDYILDQYSFKMSNLLETILGYVPKISGFASVIFTMLSFADSLALSRIRDASGYTKIINTYSREFGTKASIVLGWDTYSTATTPSNAYQEAAILFSAYNP